MIAGWKEWNASQTQDDLVDGEEGRFTGMLRFVVILVAAYLLYRVVRRLILPVRQEKPDSPEVVASIVKEDLLEDPNCGTYVPQSNAIREEMDGKTLYFCSRQCRDEYRRNRN